MNYLLLAAFLFFAYRRLLTYLHIYQQEEYDSPRFLRWVLSTRSIDLRFSSVVLVIGAVALANETAQRWGVLLLAVAATVFALRESDPLKASKKPLALTARARRILFFAFTITAIAALLLAITNPPLLLWLIAIQFIPLALTIANLMLTPFEKRTQQRYWNEAHSKLKSLHPTVVGITGSYGKTSTKHILGHILELQAPALITPGSVNTPMGVARIIRERLAAHHRFFVCEMGAYGPGSIARLCRLAPPEIGVITAIGKAHYERFKSLETVASTKFELAQAVAGVGGKVIVHEQVLDFQPAQKFVRNSTGTIVVGSGPAATAKILSSGQSANGIYADMEWQGQTYSLRAPIFGEHHIGNMAVAFATACTIGVSPADAALALASTPQITHRLEVKSGIAHSRLIDDAYNSNPVGFASALRLLDTLSVNGGRRILVTPGMVEMGAAHDEDHRIIGQLAATYVDVLVAVLPDRIQSMIDAYTGDKPGGLVIPCLSFRAARAWLEENVRSDDVVLLENDLPDLYEAKLKL